MNNKAYLVRFFADSSFRVEGPFPPEQVKRHISKADCFPVWKDPLIAVWAAPLSADALRDYEPAIRQQVSKLSTRRYQIFRAAHYWAQFDRHWQTDEDESEG